MKIIHNKLNKSRQKMVEKFLTKDITLKVIGSGATAKVYNLDASAVLRVQKDSEDYPAQVYADWAKFCIKTRSKHLPKLHFMAEDAEGTVITVMEKLSRVPYKYDKKTKLSTDDVVNYLEDYLCTEERLNKTWLGAMTANISAPAITRLRDRMKAASIYPNDLHTGNVMFRADGEQKVLVITDPVC